MDKIASPYEYMFLPDYIESGFDHASITTDGQIQPLVKTKRSVYESRTEEPPGGLPNPYYLFSIILIVGVALTVRDFKRKKLSNWFDAILFGLVGAVGLLLLLLWIATDHQAAARNFNILWALPTHLIAAVAFAKQPGWLKYYFLTVTVILLLTVISWPILPQNLNDFLIPIVATLLVRSVTQFRLRQLVS
jgi:hypothetical protein